MNTDKLLGTARDYIPLVNKLAYYFQVRDDFINLQSQDVRLHARLALRLVALTCALEPTHTRHDTVYGSQGLL